MNGTAEFLEKARQIKERIVAWRREIHAYPELAYEEHRTAGLVADVLRRLGLEVAEGIAGTGVAARLRGSNPGPSRGLRADMDALPIQEETGLPFSSKNEGIMHACCHDGHVAMLLGAASILAGMTDRLEGEVIFVFQPAEEGGAGAHAMIESGLLDRFPMNALFGHHIMPLVVPAGTVMTRKGLFTANSDRFDMVVQGHGGHASMPHLTLDPVVSMGALIGAINTITSRNTDPFTAAVVSIGEASAGSSYNAIPDKAVLRGSVRTTDEKTRDLISRRLFEVAEGVGKAHSVEIDCRYRRGYPGLFNDPDLTGRTLELAKRYWGEKGVIEKETPFMGSEDFAFFAKEVPACFFMIGVEGTAGVHHPAMTFDESVLLKGAAWEAFLAAEYR
ncbi:MAG: M20 metallopeptidase family protein [Thermovirgaceae bacterium]